MFICIKNYTGAQGEHLSTVKIKYYKPPVVYATDRSKAVVRLCNHVIAVYSENKLQHYATAYRNHKSADKKLCLVSNLYFSSKPG